ncbi:MAG: signal recognition particle-docking protein FtsY [Alphaproteobacteria bacterium]|nr:signal recognition particle-docking protein FtsY [Alphaproteobacteria bacterium]
MTGWLSRLKAGLGKTATRLTQGISALVTKRRLDRAMLDELEETLIQADLGVATSAKLVERLRRERFDKEVTGDEVREAFAAAAAEILAPVASQLRPEPARKPHVVLVVGVNGSGKTTTIGKLAHRWKADGLSVMLAAGDTFRAAAVEQLQAWGGRAGVPVVAGAAGADSAGLAYEALERARRDGVDVLAIDTAGRLHNKAHLMEELAKLVRVIRKLDPTAPHDTVLVLDATVGQNAHNQVEVFSKALPLTGLVVTKLDGTAKGGVLVALADAFRIPVIAVGVGESAEDLRPFESTAFARSLMGLDAA